MRTLSDRHTLASLCLLAALAGSIAGSAPAQRHDPRDGLKLLASDGAMDDAFGWTVAIDRGVIAVGTIGDDDNGTGSGSAYLFDVASREQLFKLIPSDGAEGDGLGNSIAIGGGIVAVGAVGDADSGLFSGSVYLFNADTGKQIAKLLPGDGAAFDSFGQSVATDGDIVAVGAVGDADNGLNSGSAHLFDADTGEHLRKILPDDGASGAAFGQSIAIDGGIVAVGAWADINNNRNTGSVYLFDADTGEQIAKLIASDGGSLDLFGWSVAIDNGIVAVGAVGDDDNGHDTGAAYLFDAASGAQIAKLLPGDAPFFGDFGTSIDIDRGVVAVGTRFKGTAYLFDATTTIQTARITPGGRNAGATARFGAAVAVNNGVVAVGAPADTQNGTGSGAAYLFDADAVRCPADVNHDGELTAGDFTFWLFARSYGDPECDQNNDGNCDATDFTAWIANFNAGC